MDDVTIFGYVTLVIWFFLAIAKGAEPTLARAFCLFMIIGTLVWGTGSL